MSQPLEDLRKKREENPKERKGFSYSLHGKEIPSDESVFTSEQRQKLHDKGYVICALTGQSLKSLRETGPGYLPNSYVHRGHQYDTEESMHSEVAFHPTEFQLPESYGTLDEQSSLVSNFSMDIQKEIPGVKAIIGRLPDYLELAVGMIEQETDESVPRGFFRFYDTSTTTRVGIDRVMMVYMKQYYNPEVHMYDNILPRGEINVAPLIVPDSAMTR
jgi:hypothetical protein